MTEPRPHRVAVLFSGGDSPGMNALLRAFVRLGHNRHCAGVMGVKDGFGGLVRTCKRIMSDQFTFARLQMELDTHAGLAGIHHANQDLVFLDHASVSGLLGRGGIMLGSSRCPEFRAPAVRHQVIDLLAGLGVTALVVCGGDGSLAGVACLAAESDLRVVGIPATIDNDLSVTDLALGVDTAVNTVAWAVGHFADTAVSHHRVMVLEVMGRHSGELARLAALASGAGIVVTPERGPLTLDRLQRIAQRLERSMLRGRRHAIVLVAEGVVLGSPAETTSTRRLAASLQDHFRREGSPFPEVEVRACILGHLQHGGSPSAADRILAARFSEAAWQAISSQPGRSGAVGLRVGRLVLQDFATAAANVRDEAEVQQLYQLQKDVSKW
jgi:6-phosphofructokinase 1